MIYKIFVLGRAMQFQTVLEHDCQHKSYCSFSKTVCIETDFGKRCLMKTASLQEMPLMKVIKERLERDA